MFYKIKKNNTMWIINNQLFTSRILPPEKTNKKITSTTPWKSKNYDITNTMLTHGQLKTLVN